MIDVAAAEGYPSATVTRVIAAAGVSRATFYEYFSDRDDCFLAALDEVQGRLSSALADAVASGPPERALRLAICVLSAFANEQPQPAKLLSYESMRGGRRLLDARDDGVEQLAEIVESAHLRLSGDATIPDISPRLVLGAFQRLLAGAFRQGRRDPDDLSRTMLGWLQRYERPIGEHRWRALRPSAAPARWTLLPETLLREPEALPRGLRRSREEVAENQRQRLLFATATVAQENGCAATTIAQITERASLDRRAFNALYVDMDDAFMALVALGFQRCMAVTARAFSCKGDWPDRVWEAGRAFVEFFHCNPAFAHVGFVEPYALAPETTQEIEDGVQAFTIFLQEGLRESPPSASVGSPRPNELEVIATSIFETAYHESRRVDGDRMSALLPHVVFLLLVPFIGLTEANRFIDARLGDQR